MFHIGYQPQKNLTFLLIQDIKILYVSSYLKKEKALLQYATHENIWSNDENWEIASSSCGLLAMTTLVVSKQPGALISISWQSL